MNGIPSKCLLGRILALVGMMAKGTTKKGKGSKVDEGTVAVNKVLQMDEMVAQILQYLPTSDIKSCNGVNQLWHQEARKLLLKRTRIKFNGPSIGTQILSYMQDMGMYCNRTVKIGKLEHQIKKRKMTLAVIAAFAKKHGSKILEFEVILGNPDIVGLFPHVTMLTLTLDGNVKIPSDLKMQHVKTLCVNEMKFETNLWSTTTPAFQARKIGLAKSLLQMCPVVEKLVLRDSFQDQFFMAFQENDDVTVPLTTITALKLVGRDHSTTGSPSKWLSRLSFPLTNLEIDIAVIQFGFLGPPSTALEEVLSKFSPTLKHLKLNITENIPQAINTTEVKFPIMPHLESLAITHHREIIGLILYGPNQVPLIKFTFDAEDGGIIDYAEQFPVLKELSIKPGSDANSHDPMDIHRNREATLAFSDMFFPEGTLPCTTVTHVDIDCALYFLHLEICNCSYCYHVKRGNVWNMVKRMANVFVNSMEVKNFRELQTKSCTCCVPCKLI